MRCEEKFLTKTERLVHLKSRWREDTFWLWYLTMLQSSDYEVQMYTIYCLCMPGMKPFYL